jgi:hypothetical protein
MARPRKSTKDEWLDQFADFDADVQEGLIDTCEMIHRQAKRRAGRVGSAQALLPAHDGVESIDEALERAKRQIAERVG